MTGGKYLSIENLSAYKAAYGLSNDVWLIVSWDYLAKDTIGKQLVRCIDSISANIAEGFGRYHKKDKIKFYYNARASVIEAQDWIKKAKDRSLLSKEGFEKISIILSKLPKEINQLIKYTNQKLTI